MRVKVVARVSQWRDLVLSGAFWSWGPLPHCCQIQFHVSSWDTGKCVNSEACNLLKL